MKKTKLIAFLPLLLVAILIDILVGDSVTGLKTPAIQKAKEQWQMFVEEWNS